MEQAQWNEYVKKVATCQWPVPAGMINDMDDWRCRSIVGRMLLVLDDIEGAMEVLSTVVKEKPDENNIPEYGLSDVEHMVLCLRDVAEIIWKLTNTDHAPLLYLDRAYRYCRRYSHPFHSASRGGIWYRRLEIMRDSGKNEQALKEAREMLEAEKENGGINPYRYFAYKYLAEDAAAAGDFAQGAQLLAEGLRYYPLNENGEKDVADAAAQEDAKERYEKYYQCTQVQYKPWEELPPVSVKRK